MLNAQFSNFTPKLDPALLDEDDGVYEVCIANISPLERKKRLNFAILQFIVGIIALTIMLFVGVDNLWRLSLFFVFASAAVSYFQWRDKT